MEKTAQPFRKTALSGNSVAYGRSRLHGPLSAQNNRSSRGRSAPLPRVAAGPPQTLSVDELRHWLEDWLADGEIQLHSPKTLQLRRDLFRRLFAFLDGIQATQCGGVELRLFFSSLQNERTGEPLSIATNETFRRVFQTFWRSMVKQNVVALNAMDRVPPIPRAKKAVAQVQPFEREQLKALFHGARRSPQPRRDLALVYLLTDTGLRASEVCSIRLRDMALSDRAVRVMGKGERERTVYFNAITLKAIWNYLRERGVSPEDDPDAALFVACSGPSAGQSMTRSGIYQAISKLCIVAGITDGKQGPHRLRHSFATEMIRNEGYQDTVQQMLGHSDPKMTQRYVTLARADMQRQHARCSPVAGLERKK